LSASENNKPASRGYHFLRHLPPLYPSYDVRLEVEKLEILFFQQNILNRWNMLEHEATGLNVFKNGLQKIRMTKMDFMD